MPHSPLSPSPRRWHARAAAILASAALALSLTALTAPAVQAAEEPSPVGCGYGTEGPLADTICWIDMSAFDAEQAKTDAGQPMSIALGNGIRMEFTARLRAGSDGLRDFAPHAFPTWSGTPIGNTAYKNTPGKPALYQVDGKTGGNQGEIILDDIQVFHDDTPQTAGYALVMADAESSNKFEGFTFTSTSPIKQIANITPEGYNPACGQELTGLGTTSVTCIGQGQQSAGDIVTSTTNPTRVSSSFHNDNDPVGDVVTTRQAVAFGVMFAKVEVTKNVASRYNEGDQFRVSTTETVSAATIAQAETGRELKSATTGVQSLLTDVEGTDVTFSEVAIGESTNLDHYSKQWTCTRNGTPVPSETLGAQASSSTVTLPVAVGDFVACTITNTALTGSVTWTKTDPTGTTLPGSEWTLTGPNGTLNITDNLTPDTNPADGHLALDTLPWGTYTLTETTAPLGYALDTTEHTFTIDGTHLNITLDAIVNTKLPVIPVDPITPPKPEDPVTTVTTPDLPDTGASDVAPFLGAGSLALLAGLGLLLARRARSTR